MYPDYVLRWKLHTLPGQNELRIEPAIIPFRDVSGVTFPDPEAAIHALTNTIDELKRTPVPSFTQADIDTLPPIGSEVWAIKEWNDGKREPMQVKVSEYSIRDGRLYVVIGYYYKPHNEVWQTEQEARAFMDQKR